MELYGMNSSENSTDYDKELWIELVESPFQYRQSWIYKTYIVVMWMIFVTAIMGNLLTCIVIYCDKSMHTTTNYYLFNLAISDLLATLGIVLEVSGQLEQPSKWMHPDFETYVCKFQYFTVLSLWNNSILVMTVLAVERYRAICCPMKSRSQPRRVRWILLSIWVLAILVALPETFMMNITRGKQFNVCLTVPTRVARGVSGVVAIVTFIVPLTIIMFVYTLIGLKINMAQKHRMCDNAFNRRDNRSKINRLIVALTLSFVICWLPYFVIRMIISVGDIPYFVQHKEFWCFAYYVTSINGWFNAVLNPLLFSLMSSKFRKSLKALWNKKIRRQNETYRITSTTIRRDEIFLDTKETRDV